MKTFAEAAKKLELFVVQDIYDTIESAEDCTVFFPVVPGLKKRRDVYQSGTPSGGHAPGAGAGRK